ncbi:hypothetical protein [Rhizobium sp. BK060]|uniref:hypothetical protein n=1 Tax=Rhizobium sp. BK060 TaxID=2587096 RepID=UPI00161C91D2|nr:hypothetical protein [Rhizobium sp. BK060]MBB3394472.1 hypothetical protein [Rhizobium sp. BK060]
MADVISLSEVRERRKAAEPVPTFDRVMERLFDALDHIEANATGEAHRAACEGIEMLLTREERMRSWPRK